MLELGYLESKNNTEILDEMSNFDEMDVSDEFMDAYMTDDSSEFNRLFWMYKDAEPHERAVIDSVFIHMCGYSFTTLVKQHLGLA